MKNFTLNNDQFEEFTKERRCARAIAVKPRRPSRERALDFANRLHHRFEEIAYRHFTQWRNPMALPFVSLAKPAAVG